jgi:hypothetical protein
MLALLCILKQGNHAVNRRTAARSLAGVIRGLPIPRDMESPEGENIEEEEGE